jgi:hypothetical protein
MAHCYHHALSSAKIWGGTPDEYLPLHQWFDESKMLVADFRHRALRHHAEGIFMLERFFGPTLTISTGRVVPVRLIGEQHVRQDLGFLSGQCGWVLSGQLIATHGGVSDVVLAVKKTPRAGLLHCLAIRRRHGGETLVME